VKAGCGVVVACGRAPQVLTEIMAGQDTGTLILSSAL
jgi:glutamate 5-kinase